MAAIKIDLVLHKQAKNQREFITGLVANCTEVNLINMPTKLTVQPESN